MTTRKQVLALAERMGAEIEEVQPGDGMPGEVLALAPAGHHWRDCDVHELVTTYYPGDKADAWRDAHERMNGGVVRCSAKEPCDGYEHGCQFWRES